MSFNIFCSLDTRTLRRNISVTPSGSCTSRFKTLDRGVQSVTDPPLEEIKKNLFVCYLNMYSWLLYIVYAKNSTMHVNNVFLFYKHKKYRFVN